MPTTRRASARRHPDGSRRGLTDRARADWLDLATATEEPEAFDPAMTADLPEPVRRWLAHPMAPGTPHR